MVTSLDKNTALVLIDLQKGIVQYPVAHPITQVLANAAKLVAAFRKANLPVVVVNVSPAGKWLNSRKDAKQVTFTPDADWLEIAPEIKTEPTDIFITKSTWSAFFETGINEELKSRNVTGIVLAGVSTSIGVEATARDASRLNYNISFASDAMTDMIADAHVHSQKIIFPRLGEVDTTDKIIEVLG
jgi:nicotinamidase-related amidase